MLRMLLSCGGSSPRVRGLFGGGKASPQQRGKDGSGEYRITHCQVSFLKWPLALDLNCVGQLCWAFQVQRRSDKTGIDPTDVATLPCALQFFNAGVLWDGACTSFRKHYIFVIFAENAARDSRLPYKVFCP
jgi:hypothetical protein